MISVKQSGKEFDAKSERSYRSSRPSSSRASSARIKALAEARAAREEADYARILAEKQKELAILTADKNAAVAKAKLDAIEQAINEEEFGEGPAEKEDAENFTGQWVHSSPALESDTPNVRNALGPKNTSEPHTLSLSHLPRSDNVPKESTPALPYREHVQPQDRMFTNHGHDKDVNYHPVISTPDNPYRDITQSQLMDSLTTVNNQIVTSLARQRLPISEPDIFDGDATLFQPWKRAFKTMLHDAIASPTQEINYLRKFTSGPPQALVDNYRKRLRDPATLLEQLWVELEKRFGSPAMISNSLLERLKNAARFSENQPEKLQ
ncbi:predicted protein, partial [Nematostella vectensis]